jgi:hypothetical protein
VGGDHGGNIMYNISLIGIVAMNPQHNEYILIKNLSKRKKKKLITNVSRALVSHICNPSQEAEIRRIEVPSQLEANSSYLQDPITKKPTITKIGLVEWLKVKALSSTPSTGEKKKRKFWRGNHSKQ